jgi:hypothetical protein
LRRTKKAFISFVPKELIKNIGDNKLLTANIIQKKVQRTIGKLRFRDIREIHGTLLTKHLNEAEINFLHGGISSSVFMWNYFNPVWISDLKQRAFKAVGSYHAENRSVKLMNFQEFWLCIASLHEACHIVASRLLRVEIIKLGIKDGWQAYINIKYDGFSHATILCNHYEEHLLEGSKIINVYTGCHPGLHKAYYKKPPIKG